MGEPVILDFSQCSIHELQEAYVQMNCWRWSKICGPKPDGFDNMTNIEKYRDPVFRKCFDSIKMHLSNAQMSMAWWTIELGKTYDEWHEWYYFEEK